MSGQAARLRGGGADPQLSYFCKKIAFTLAEVLIILGIIGVVAVLMLTSLITNIQNKGFVEKLLKTYSTLQTVTNKVIDEDGPVTSWQFVNHTIDTDNTKNEYIRNQYVKHLNVLRTCFGESGNQETACSAMPREIKSLNNQAAYSLDGQFTSSDGSQYNRQLWSHDNIILSDGTLINISFKDNSYITYWSYPASMVFNVDVNGKKGPNKIGRDIFFFYLEKSSGKVLPFVSPDSTHRLANTCDKTKTGHSCAYRVITEGKMNY